MSNDPCLIQVCPGSRPPLLTTVEVGTIFQVFANAVGADNQTDLEYSGSAIVTSSDTAAVLPPGLTFVQGEGQFTAILSTVGDQTITVTDSVRGITGSFVMTVTAPTSPQVPTLSNAMMLLFLTALAAVGVWAVRGR